MLRNPFKRKISTFQLEVDSASRLPFDVYVSVALNSNGRHLVVMLVEQPTYVLLKPIFQTHHRILSEQSISNSSAVC